MVARESWERVPGQGEDVSYRSPDDRLINTLDMTMEDWKSLRLFQLKQIKDARSES